VNGITVNGMEWNGMECPVYIELFKQGMYFLGNGTEITL
jgi:hypothetical protein